MHILEQYALSCGVKVRAPHMDSHIFPLKSQKYITIHNSNKFDTRNYNYWADVIDYMRPFLDKENISIVQVGGKEDGVIDGVDENTAGKTSLKQTAWIVQHALLHVGVDSFPVHAASAFGVPVVALYSNMHPSHSRPYWSPEGSYVCLESDRKGRKPSYAAVEPEKTINMINPEDIASATLRQLSIPHEITAKTIFTGNYYHTFMVEIVPDFVPPPKLFSNGVLNIRMDLHHDEENLIRILSQRKCSIIATKPIDLRYLAHFRGNVHQIHFEMKEAFSENYISELKKMGIKYQLTASGQSEEELNLLRIELFDEIIVKHDPPVKKDYDITLTENCYYLSNKFLLSKGQMYASQHNWKKGVPTENLKKSYKVVDNESFWEEADHFRIFEQK